MNDVRRDISHLPEDVRPILNQNQVEHQMLNNAKDAVLAVLDWKTEGEMFSRKLSSLRFATDTFQTQLKRIFALEEHDGYMNVVLEAGAHFGEKVGRFKGEHERLRNDLELIVTQLERLMPNDHPGLGSLCQLLHKVIRRCEDHAQREAVLVQDALMTDFGAGD
jgi:hypothetical protein